MPTSLRRRQSPRQRNRLVYGLVGLFTLVLLGSGAFLVAAHMEDDDSFCASCHTEPESTFFARTQASQAVDLASAHHLTDDPTQATRCIDCHSGSGVSGRAAAIALGATDMVSFVTGNARQPAPLTSPIPDANCLKCHADVTATRSFNRHFHRFLSQWQAVDRNAATCVSCHAGHAADGDPSLGFLNEQRATDVCQACHRVAGE